MSTLQDTPNIHGRDHGLTGGATASSPAALKLARGLSGPPHDARARAAGEPRGAGLTARPACDEGSCGLRGRGAWRLLGLGLGLGVLAVAILRSGRRRHRDPAR